jgi:hypothetical protein
MNRLKIIIILGLLAVGFESLFAQTIDRSQYEGTTLFDYMLWYNEQGLNVPSRKFKATVYFFNSSGTNMSFTDEAGAYDIQTFEIKKRWPTINRGQKVTIYFTAKLMLSIIDDIDFGSSSETDVRPWQQYIDDGRSGKTGWYLRSIGNGRYEEVHY